MKIKINQIILLALLFTISISKASAGINDELIECCKSGNLECVKALVEKGADVNYEDEEKKTALMYACEMHSKLFIVEYLIMKGANVNSTDNSGKTVLMSACQFVGNTNVAKYLINKGANVKAIDFSGWTALHFAINTAEVELCELLIQKGASINAISGGNFVQKETPLHLASRLGDRLIPVKKLLLKKGANRADLVNSKQRQWWFCDNSENCINKMRITFENNSFAPISSVTFMLTIKNANGSILYKKKHTAQCKIDNGESAPCKEFMLAEKVYDYNGGFGDGTNATIDVEVLSVK